MGCWPFLTEMAMRLELRGFEVYNDDADGGQAVIALIEGDEGRVARFYNSACKMQPELAAVDSVQSGDYAGDIMPLWQFAFNSYYEQGSQSRLTDLRLLLDHRTMIFSTSKAPVMSSVDRL